MCRIDNVASRASLERVNLIFQWVQAMSSPNLEDRARSELVQLLDLQLTALEKQVFGVLPDRELQEYERRHDQIAELYDKLRHLRVAAAA